MRQRSHGQGCKQVLKRKIIFGTCAGLFMNLFPPFHLVFVHRKGEYITW